MAKSETLVILTLKADAMRARTRTRIQTKAKEKDGIEKGRCACQRALESEKKFQP